MPAIIASAGVRRSGPCILREVTSAAPQLGSEDQKDHAAGVAAIEQRPRTIALFFGTRRLSLLRRRRNSSRPGCVPSLSGPVLESGPAPAGSPRFRVAASGLLRAEAACRPSGVNFILRRSSQAEPGACNAQNSRARSRAGQDVLS